MYKPKKQLPVSALIFLTSVHSILSVGVEFPYVVALLRNNSVEIHNLVNQKLVQIIQINPSVEPRTISHGFGVRLLVSELLQKLSWVPLTLHKNDEASTEAEGTKNGQADEAMEQEKNKIMRKISAVPAQVILGGKDSIMALANTPLIVQVRSDLITCHIGRIQKISIHLE